MAVLPRLGRLRRTGAGGSRPAPVDPGRVLRRRRSPLQLALGGTLIALILVVEALILRAYVDVSRSTDIFRQVSYKTGFLVNVRHETALLNAKVEELPSSRDLKGAKVRQGLLAQQLGQLEGLSEDDPLVEATLLKVKADLRQVDQAIASAEARPTEANLRAEAAGMRPVFRRLNLALKELYDKEEQAFFGALTGTLNARASSERLLVGFSSLVLLVGVALALSLRQRVRSDFARAWRALTAEVDERKAAEAALRASEERFRSLVQNSSDVITILDADGTPRWHSESMRRVFGYDPEQLLHSKDWTLVHPDDRDRLAGFVAEAASRPGVTPAITWRMRHRDGTWLHTESVAANLLDDPNVGGLVLNTRDVSERKQLEDQLVHQAFHDGLTGLANRTRFTERVEQALATIGPTNVAVLFVDLDDFKHVNDSLGHASGDQLLVAAAKRLKSCLRPPPAAGRRRRGRGCR